MPRIAVIGAGVSGLICAQVLSDQGFDVTVFEKSRGVGGRMSTRRANGNLQFDHGAQYFTVRDERFRRYVDSWVQDGIVEKWVGTIAVFGGERPHPDQTPEQHKPQAPLRYTAKPGMNGICKHLAEDQTIILNTRVEQIRAGDENSNWEVVEVSGNSLGIFENVIVSAPARQSADILCNFPQLANVAASCEMQPCWAAMLAFNKPLALEFAGAFVNESPLSWMARNSTKPGRPTSPEAWVLHAASEWTKAHADCSKEEIVDLLLGEFQLVTGLTGLQPSYATAHFWRYAIPANPLPDHALFLNEAGVGACGDWCGGPRVEGAFLSGAAAAGRVLGMWNERWQSLLAMHPVEDRHINQRSF